MGRGQRVVHLGQRIAIWLAVVLLTWATVGCAKPTEPTVLISEPTQAPNRLVGQIAEVSPPETLELLKQIIDAYTPQVRILSPRPGEVVDSTRVSMRVQVRGLPLFKDETWQLGPHLHVFLDDQPYRAVYNLAEPIVFEDLAPGTHTIRVFASRPWHESFKNQGAFDQRTFHVVAPTPQNEVNASAPLLTYSRPQGSYGAEPIMLDFYLTNAPLHLNAQDEAGDDLHDWRIRCTVNGQSFVFDQWQPIYLKGFQPGQNWVQLELIDENGQPIDNRFNNTVRIIDYQPGGQDTLSRLVRGELDLREVASIIDPTYQPPKTPKAKAAEPTPEPGVMPPLDNSPAPDSAEGSPLPTDPAALDASEDAANDTPKPEPSAEELAPVPPPTPERPEAAANRDDSQDSEPAEPTIPDAIAPDVAPLEDTPASPQPEPPIFDDSTVEDLGSGLVVPSIVEDDAAIGIDLEPEDAAERPNPFLLSDEPTEVISPEAAPDEADQSPEALGDLDFLDAIAPIELDLEQGEPAETPDPDVLPSDAGLQSFMERMKGWKQKAMELNPFADDDESLPEPAQIPVYRTPDTLDTPENGEPTPPSPELVPAPSSPEREDDLTLPRAMPELIEPYLTQPYLTEPRLERPRPEDDPDAETPENPAAQPNPGAERPSGLERPYI